MRRRRESAAAPAPWSRRRLRLLVVVSAMAIVLVVVTTTWTLAHLLLGGSAVDSAHGRDVAGPVPGDAGGEVGLVAALPGPLTTARSGQIVVPVATTVGEGDVRSGFPRTAEGALAQLVAIDHAALTSMSLPRAQLVADLWIAPGGPASEDWSVVRAVDELLTGSGQPADGSQLEIVVEPAMGGFRQESDLVGTVDVDGGVVTACVDFVVSLGGVTTDQIAAADCQRMVWVDDRWLIAPGDEESPPPSLWPGSAASVDAGWHWLVSE